MLNGLVRGEALADRDKRLPFVAHQVGLGSTSFSSTRSTSSIERLSTTKARASPAGAPLAIVAGH